MQDEAQIFPGAEVIISKAQMPDAQMPGRLRVTCPLRAARKQCSSKLSVYQARSFKLGFLAFSASFLFPFLALDLQ